MHCHSLTLDLASTSLLSQTATALREEAKSLAFNPGLARPAAGKVSINLPPGHSTVPITASDWVLLAQFSNAWEPCRPPAPDQTDLRWSQHMTAAFWCLLSGLWWWCLGGSV